MDRLRSITGIISITQRCYARIGLLGNPSDGYNGCTLSLSLANFWAEVTMSASPTIHFVHHPLHDGGAFTSLEHAADHLEACGYGSGVDLLKSICVVFYRHCSRHGVPLHRPRRGFTMSWTTNIPRQSGLAGSSAIVTAGLRCLMDWYEVGAKQIPRHIQPNLVLAAETALGITAGLQDRVIQVYGGLVVMDFSELEARGYGQYTALDPALLPPLFLIWGDGASSSSKVHSTVRQRWKDGDAAVHEGMSQLAQCARDGRVALEAGDLPALARLMDTNFTLRRQIFGDAAVGAANLRMVQVAQSVGASAKLSGSGGAVVAICPDGEAQQHALQLACEQAGLNIARVLVGPTEHQ